MNKHRLNQIIAKVCGVIIRPHAKKEDVWVVCSSTFDWAPIGSEWNPVVNLIQVMRSVQVLRGRGWKFLLADNKNGGECVVMLTANDNTVVSCVGNFGEESYAIAKAIKEALDYEKKARRRR